MKLHAVPLTETAFLIGKLENTKGSVTVLNPYIGTNIAETVLTVLDKLLQDIRRDSFLRLYIQGEEVVEVSFQNPYSVQYSNNMRPVLRWVGFAESVRNEIKQAIEKVCSEKPHDYITIRWEDVAAEIALANDKRCDMMFVRPATKQGKLWYANAANGAKGPVVQG